MPSKPALSSSTPWSALLLATVLSLTACATISPEPVPICPRPAPMPSVLTPQPQQSYSDSARAELSSWRQQLTATPLIP